MALREAVRNSFRMDYSRLRESVFRCQYFQLFLGSQHPNQNVFELSTRALALFECRTVPQRGGETTSVLEFDRTGFGQHRTFVGGLLIHARRAIHELEVRLSHTRIFRQRFHELFLSMGRHQQGTAHNHSDAPPGIPNSNYATEEPWARHLLPPVMLLEPTNGFCGLSSHCESRR